MNPNGALLIGPATITWLGPPLARLTYPSLIYAPEADYELPLRVGSVVGVGPYRLRVVGEEPETATVLVRRCGPWGWLWWAGWKIARWLRGDH